MKIKLQLKHILVASFGLYTNILLGHDVPVHWAITLNAAESAYNDSPAYASFVNIISSDLSYTGRSGATNALKDGSGFEDNKDNGDIGGKRSLNHFFDPLDQTYGKGLSDFPTDSRKLEGLDSFTWASVSNCPGYNVFLLDPTGWLKNQNTTNIWSWPNARGYEWLGLTATNQSDRQTNLLAMFRAVGQVMHLLEDASQPQHVRNEQHLDTFGKRAWESPIEDYGNDNVANLNYGDGSMLDWRGAGFTKLEDFWDTHKYNGSSSAALIADNNENPNGGPSTLGLAEWCNGNFLGDRHLYADFYLTKINDIYEN